MAFACKIAFGGTLVKGHIKASNQAFTLTVSYMTPEHSCEACKGWPLLGLLNDTESTIHIQQWPEDDESKF